MSNLPVNQSDSIPPEGFTFERIDEVFGVDFGSGPRRGEFARLGLFLPTSLLRAEERASERAAEMKQDEQRVDRAQGLFASLAAAKSDKTQPTREGHDDITDPSDALDVLCEQEQAVVDNPQAWHKVYTISAVAELLNKAQTLTIDKEIRKRDEALSTKLLKAGEYRKIASRSGNAQQQAAVMQALVGLRQMHPHFSEVVDFVAQHLTLASRSKRALALPPMLLNGEPGLGKTHFASDLASVIGTSCRRVALDTPVTAATLMGSDRRWANTQVGLLFDQVCLGEHANPIILLDEIDKAAARRDWNPLEPLHSLLEPSTASKIRDVSADFEFDASQVIWIATSNHSRLLSTAIRSRFKEFEIRRPSAAQALISARAVLQKSFADLNLVDFEAPGRDLAVAMAHLTAREMTQELKQAVATAIQKGKSTVSAEDLSAHVLQEANAAQARPGDGPLLH